MVRHIVKEFIKGADGMLKTYFRYLLGPAVRLFPGSPFRKFRNFIWRLGGYDVAYTANLMPTVRLVYGDIQIGGHAFLGEEVLVTGGSVFIGENCDIAPRVIIHAGTHELGGSKRRAGEAYAGKILIGNGTWIGTSATILSGVTLGTGCLVAAGSLVKAGEYPSDVLIAGVPAKVEREFEKD